MCLAVPMRVIERTGYAGKVAAGNVTYEVNFALLPQVKVNDFVLVHAGFAIQVIDQEEARKTLALFEELLSKDEFAAQGEPPAALPEDDPG